MRKNLKLKINEALSSVLPITLIVLLLSFTLTPMPTGTLMLFIFGAALLIIGMGFFSLGADIAMMPMGDGMGRKLVGHNRTALAVIVCFLIGAVVTIAEPDLQVLARQVPAVPDMIIIPPAAPFNHASGNIMMLVLIAVLFQLRSVLVHYKMCLHLISALF